MKKVKEKVIKFFSIIPILLTIVATVVVVGIDEFVLKYIKCDERIKLLIIVIVIVIVMIAMVLIIFKIVNIIDKKTKLEKKVEENLRLKELKEKYSEYVAIVNETVKKPFKENISESDLKSCWLSLDIDYYYLFYFEKYLEWISKNRIKGKPDSFIIASCLMYSIIKSPILKSEITSQEIEEYINYTIAFESALKVISEPTTYYEDDNSNWIPVKHPKVEISIPNGIIKGSTLYDRIFHTIIIDAECDYYVMQLSNLFHLIYLNCK